MSMFSHTISINFLFDFLYKCTHTCLLKHWKLKLYHDNFYDFFYHTRSSLYPEKITGTKVSCIDLLWENPTSIPFGYHSIYRAQFFHGSYHLYNWCKIPVVFDCFFFLIFCLCGVIETWRNRDWGRCQISKQKKNDFLKILLIECSFLTKGKYFMVV